MAVDWAATAAYVFRDAVHQELVEAVLKDADVFAGSPNYWISKEDINVNSGRDVCSAEACVMALFNSCVKGMLPDDWEGAEWWVQVYEPGKGLKFHFDKDEQAFAKHGTMRHPHFSSILYLTGTEEDEYRQGPTVILQQLFNAATCNPEPDTPESCILVFPNVGQFCVFDGALGHGVLESCNTSKRVTLLINWWRNCGPEGVQPLEQETNDKLSNLPLIKPGPQLLQRGVVPSSHVLGISLQQPPSDAILVDDLLQGTEQRDAVGQHVAAASFKHPGYVLYPLEPEGQPPQKTMAAFVPAHMMEASSSESDD